MHKSARKAATGRIGRLAIASLRSLKAFCCPQANLMCFSQRAFIDTAWSNKHSMKLWKIFIILTNLATAMMSWVEGRERTLQMALAVSQLTDKTNEDF
jgi:hypothetical protein